MSSYDGPRPDPASISACAGSLLRLAETLSAAARATRDRGRARHLVDLAENARDLGSALQAHAVVLADTVGATDDLARARRAADCHRVAAVLERLERLVGQP